MARIYGNRGARPPRRRQDNPIENGPPSRGSSNSSGDDRRSSSSGSQPGVLGPGGNNLPRTYSVERPNYWELTFGRPNYWKQALGQQRQGYGTAEIKPRYFDGDQFRPAGRDTDSIIDMQRRMMAAGFLAPGDFNLGVWGPETIDAYSELLGYANTVGLDAESALIHYANSNMGGMMEGEGGGEGGTGGSAGGWTLDPETGEMIPTVETFVPPPLEIRTTNKDDLKAVMRQATALLGQGFSEAEVAELVESYNWMEIKAQKDAYDTEVGIMQQEFAGTSPGGQAYVPSSAAREVSVPSPEVYLDKKARERDPAGYQATQIAEDFAPSFFDALQGYF